MSDGGVLELETGFDYATVRGLMRKGHTVKFSNGPYGGYQAIARDPETGVYAGASESPQGRNGGRLLRCDARCWPRCWRWAPARCAPTLCRDLIRPTSATSKR